MIFVCHWLILRAFSILRKPGFSRPGFLKNQFFQHIACIIKQKCGDSLSLNSSCPHHLECLCRLSCLMSCFAFFFFLALLCFGGRCLSGLGNPILGVCRLRQNPISVPPGFAKPNFGTTGFAKPNFAKARFAKAWFLCWVFAKARC